VIFLSSLFLLGVAIAVTRPGRKKKKRCATDTATGKTVTRCTKNDLKMELLVINWNVIWSSEVLQRHTTPSKPSGMCMYHQVEHRKL